MKRDYSCTLRGGGAFAVLAVAVCLAALLVPLASECSDAADANVSKPTDITDPAADATWTNSEGVITLTADTSWMLEANVSVDLTSITLGDYKLSISSSGSAKYTLTVNGVSAKEGGELGLVCIGFDGGGIEVSGANLALRTTGGNYQTAIIYNDCGSKTDPSMVTPISVTHGDLSIDHNGSHSVIVTNGNGLQIKLNDSTMEVTSDGLGLNPILYTMVNSTLTANIGNSEFAGYFDLDNSSVIVSQCIDVYSAVLKNGSSLTADVIGIYTGSTSASSAVPLFLSAGYTGETATIQASDDCSVTADEIYDSFYYSSQSGGSKAAILDGGTYSGEFVSLKNDPKGFDASDVILEDATITVPVTVDEGNTVILTGTITMADGGSIDGACAVDDTCILVNGTGGTYVISYDITLAEGAALELDGGVFSLGVSEDDRKTMDVSSGTLVLADGTVLYVGSVKEGGTELDDYEVILSNGTAVYMDPSIGYGILILAQGQEIVYGPDWNPSGTGGDGGHTGPVYSYTINFDANSGSGAPATLRYTSSSTKVTLMISSTEPTRSGYTFLGWATTSDATSAEYTSTGSITLTSDGSFSTSITLYAVWGTGSSSGSGSGDGGSGSGSGSGSGTSDGGSDDGNSDWWIWVLIIIIIIILVAVSGYMGYRARGKN